jgi:23S rRNA pseudouridine1911/1915/1917 synthase
VGAGEPRLLGAGEHTLALWKPPGVTVFPPHDGAGASVLGWLLQAFPEQARPWSDGFDGGILHRLDRWTSGLLLVARTDRGFEDGRRAFEQKRLGKNYRFLSAGRVPWREHTVTWDLAHDRKDRRKMTWRRGQNTPHRGRWYPASTRFRRVQGGWEARMSTGVMHQIRLHAASVGLPLLGDRLYGGALDPQGEGRFYLHHGSVDGWFEALPAAPLPADWPPEVRP